MVAGGKVVIGVVIGIDVENTGVVAAGVVIIGVEVLGTVVIERVVDVGGSIVVSVKNTRDTGGSF